MIRSLTPPSAGQPIRASFFAELLREIQANRLVNGSGYRTKRTPNGTSLVIHEAKASASSPAKVPGCFEIRRPSGGEDSEGYDPGGFDNPYYSVGSNHYYLADAVEMGFGYESCFLALVIDSAASVPNARIEEFGSFSEMQQAAQDDLTTSIHPLYEIGNKGIVIADLRNIPTFPQFEF